MNRHIFRGVVASGAYTAITMLAGVVQLRLIVGVLDPGIAGIWLLFLTIGSYIAWLDLGMSPTVAREVSLALGAPGRSEQERTARVAELLTTLWHVFRVIAIAVGLLGLLAGELALSHSQRYTHNLEVRIAWAIFSVGVCINLVGSISLTGLFGLGDVAAEKLIRSLAALVGLAITMLALMLGWGIVGLSAVWALQGSVAGLIGWRRLVRRLPELSGTGCVPNWQLARNLAAPSLKLASIQLGTILILQSANPLIAATIGVPSIPPYEALSRIAATLMTLALLIVNSSTPFLSMAYAAGQLSAFTDLLLRNLRLGVGLMVVLCSFVAVNGDRIVSVWLGRPMFAGFAVLWVLLIMVMLEVHHVIFATAAMAVGQIAFVWAALTSGILNIIFAAILAGRLGLVGIALAITVGQVLTNNWYAPYFAIRYFKIPVSVLTRQVWIPMVTLLLAEVAVDVLLRQLAWLGQPGFWSLAADFTVSGCVGAAIWAVLALPSSERAEIGEWLHGRSLTKAEQA